jgi:hypothetical protein
MGRYVLEEEKQVRKAARQMRSHSLSHHISPHLVISPFQAMENEISNDRVLWPRLMVAAGTGGSLASHMESKK